MTFDYVAPIYRYLEYIAFGGALQRRRTAMLKFIDHSARALLIGEGDGRFLAAFRANFPDAEIDVIEPSAAMIRLARRRAGSPKVRFLHASAPEDLEPEGPYDLITTHFVLDVMTTGQVAELLARVLPAAAPDARWLVSEFCPASRGARAAIATMYFFFKITAGLRTVSIPAYAPLFSAAGLRLARRQTAWGGFIASELWERRL